MYRLKGGQYTYNGHVINFFQDIQTFVKKLPHSLSDIKGLVNVCCKTENFHKDFRIRKQKVLEALIWLKKYNVHYKHIEIDISTLSENPEDFYYSPRIDSEDNDIQLEDNDPFVHSSAVPKLDIYSDEEKLKHNLKFPTLQDKPIPELSTDWYIVKAFPDCFPYGIGDLCELKGTNISPRDYFQYLMNFHDHRFSSHKIFPYFAWNSIMRWECLTKGTVYMKKHPDLKKVNVEMMKSMLMSGKSIGKDIMIYSSNIRSTKSYWFSRSAEIQQMVHDLKLPTIFFTLSAADFHWPRLYDLLQEANKTENLSETQRHNMMFENPKICSDYFFETATMFIEHILLVQFNVKDYWYRFEWQVR